MIFKKIKEKQDDVFKNKLKIVDITKKVFRNNPKMIWYPFLGAIFSIISFVFLIFISKGSGAVVIALIVWFLLFNIFVTFFNAATVACARIALNGGNPKFSDGINESFKRLSQIINWAIFNSFIGLFMGLLSEIKVAKYFAYAGEIVWSFVTYFIIPIMVFENKGVKDTIGESQKLIKKNWGRSIMGEFKISFMSMIPFLIVLTLLIFSSVLKDEIVTYSLFVITIFVLIIGMLLNFSLRNIFCTVLYMNVKGKLKLNNE